MLYIFNPNETLIALLKPDFTRSTRSTGPAETSRAFLSAAFPAEFDREPTEGCPYWDAVHREVLNGENTFTFTVPADQVDAAYVRESNLVAFKDLDSYWQFFEVKRIVDLHGDGLTRTAYCEHIFYELLDDIVTDKRPSGSAIAALSGMLEGTRWQVGIVDDLGASSTTAYYISALEAVQKVAKAWKGELNWRCVVVGGVITRYVDLKAMVGTDTGKQFAYSKDILSIEREVDSSNVATALYGRGKGVELDSGSYGRRLTFADVVAADKPLGQEWIGDNTALAQWGRGGRHRFDVFTDEEETDAEKLLQKTRDELDRRKVPRVTYRLDVASLEQLTGYEHEKVRLGDLVRVIDREFTPELVVSARVIEIERDILDPANTKVVLGSFAPTIVEATVNTARRVDEMANKPYNTKWLDGKISVLQNEIENTQSYVFQTADDGILILDAADYATATKAMKLGGGIFAIANQKDGQGGWNWRTFGDGSGFTADLITAGIIDAGLVQIGHATTFEAGYDPTDNHVYFQYSVDGATNWHDTFNSASDKYMRQKVGDNGTWSDPMRVVGEDGQGIRKFTSQPAPPYDVGDLWIGGSDGKNTLICTTARSTGSFVASDWGQVTESSPSVGMGVDSDCVGLWHFDGSLNNHKGVAADADAADADALFGGGCFGQALNIATGKNLKVPTAGMSASQGTISFRVSNLSTLATLDTYATLLELPDSSNSTYFILWIDGGNNLCLTYKKNDSSFDAIWGPSITSFNNWDLISLSWGSSRLSLSINDAEVGFAIDHFLPSGSSGFWNCIYIGSDRFGDEAAYAILIDELRIDKVYRDVAIRTGWYKTGVPFYTSEDMKQWPGYLKAETDGVKVYDSSNELRVLLGSWLRGEIRKYGLKIIDGEIYSSIIRSGAEDATSYIQLSPGNEPLTVKEYGKTALNIWASSGGLLQIYDTTIGSTGDMAGQIVPMNDAMGQGLKLHARSNAGINKALGLQGSSINCAGDLYMFSGEKHNVEQTENYGQRGLVVRESPESKYIDEGIGALIDGQCRVDIDPIFMECIEPNTPDSKWHIQLTPYADVNLFVVEIGETYFIVKEKSGGTSTGAEFTWSLSATRKNYSGIRLVEVERN